MKNIKIMMVFGLLFAGAVQADDNILTDWVVIPSGDLVLQNNSDRDVTLVYQVPTSVGLRKGAIKIEPKTSSAIAISAYQVFRSDLSLLSNGHDVLVDARKHLAQAFTQKYGVEFNCTDRCCSVTCQSEQLIRAFMAKGKRFTSELEVYRKSLAGTKVKLEFSRDAKGSIVTTRIGGFTATERL